MIDDSHRQFIESLDIEEVYDRVLVFARCELERRGFSQEDAEEVANAAFARLYDPTLKAWDEIPPSMTGLMNYLGNRVDDVVRKKNRERERTPHHQCSTRIPEHEHPFTSSVTAHELIEFNEVADQWLQAAADHSSEVGEVVLEYLSGNTKLATQATTLKIPASRVAELRRKAKRILSSLAQHKATR